MGTIPLSRKIPDTSREFIQGPMGQHLEILTTIPRGWIRRYLTPVDNPYLDPLVNNLRHVINPGSAVKIDPFPMSWFYPEFNHCYYSYHGSLTYPPCSELVTWIIQPEPVAISPRQLSLFRVLETEDGPIISNSRPLQHLNNRPICYYD
uniref:Alpha-carbonic anhydrase domain-containing protein n=1 Tax=Timema tahoe TaxID=61484 RepID=A0A7R9FKZ4_9NEOP|nr:unnamed protein product [Timema tahoe]